jgi:hypothetical protein
MHGRHVNQEAAGKRDVARDARAFFAERFFGDLDDYILTGFEHFGNELRAARRAGTLEAVVAMMSATTAGTATLEASAGTAAAMIATAAITTTVTSAIWATVAAAIVASTAVASATAIWALEARTGIATADARGIARSEFFARSASRPRRTSLAGEQDRIVFVRGSGGFTSGRDRFGLELAFVMIDGVAVLVLLLFFAVSVSAGFGGMNRFLVRGVGFDVGAFLRAQRVNFFDCLGFFHGIVGNFDFIDGVNFLGLFLFVLFFVVFFIERRAANDGVGRSVRLNLILLRFDDAGGESSDFVIAQRRFRSALFARVGALEFVSLFAIWRYGIRLFD